MLVTGRDNTDGLRSEQLCHLTVYLLSRYLDCHHVRMQAPLILVK